jgi:Probable cobalt transporter subunit (CbtA)
VPAATTGADLGGIVTVIHRPSLRHGERMIATQPHPTISVQMRLISRGLLAGAMGGVVVFASARLIVEPVITASTRQHGSELFSHGLPANVGMACAVVVFGAAMGGLLATAFVVSHGRLSAIRPGTLVLLLAADAFAALSVLPSVSYPPGPLSVGDETATRIGLYLLMVGLSLTLIIGGVWVGRRLATRIGSWNATLIGAGAYVACIAAAMWIRPSGRSRLMTSAPYGCPRWPRTWCYGPPSQRFSHRWRTG